MKAHKPEPEEVHSLCIAQLVAQQLLRLNLVQLALYTEQFKAAVCLM